MPSISFFLAVTFVTVMRLPTERLAEMLYFVRGVSGRMILLESGAGTIRRVRVCVVCARHPLMDSSCCCAWCLAADLLYFCVSRYAIYFFRVRNGAILV